jgi:oxaloacetate decarboxylase alpha subunit
MPAAQVDAMLANGPARRHYNPQARPITSLLRELTQRPAISHVVVEKPGFRIELRASQAADAAHV